MTDNTQPEALMQLADAYAEASFDQALHNRTLDDAPEIARSALAAAILRQHARIVELVEAQQPAPSAAADLIAALEEARSAINSMKVEAETAGQGDEQMMLEACETISNEGLQADIAIRAALASAPKPSSTPQADSQPAPVATNYKQALGSTNCMQCCVSYMLGLPLESVPDFATAGGWDRFASFAESQGYAAVMLPGNHEFEADYLASGTTERGTPHMVVMNDGKLVHDPHPSNAGLVEVQSVWLLAKKAGAQWRHDERAAFEASAKAYTSNVSFERDEHDYADMTASLLWHGWKLRAARAPADSVTAPAGGANWQDISTAPKDGTRFVAVGQNYGLDSEAQHTCMAQWFRGCWIEVSEWNEISELKYLTHWMPLPPLPGSAARAPADSQPAPVAQVDALTDSYIQQVPDKCDRIVWRGNYYHLPLTPPAPSAAAMSPINRLIAYSAAATLRDLGYEWDEGTEEWKPSPVPRMKG